ncbi:MAG: hypothetical protein J0I09_04375 [Sphingobacteriia bacterium]|nr:hypothetical protein [Sphingobacteriia bacterium]
MKNNKLIYTVAILGVCLLYSFPLFAQPSTPSDAPVDGGLSMLIAAGAGYGIKKVKESRKKQ